MERGRRGHVLENATPQLQCFCCLFRDEFGTVIRSCLEGDHAGAALAMCRDLIVAHDPSRIAGFADTLAAVYRHLGRGLLAEIAVENYR